MGEIVLVDGLTHYINKLTALLHVYQLINGPLL